MRILDKSYYLIYLPTYVNAHKVITSQQSLTIIIAHTMPNKNKGEKYKTIIQFWNSANLQL